MAFKVYCKTCKFIGSMGWLCSKDPSFVVEDNYFHCMTVEKHADAREKNAHNDCQDFEEKKGWLRRLFR